MSWQFLKKMIQEDKDFSQKFIDFKPGIGKVYLFPEETGHTEIQMAEREKGLGWHAFTADDQLYLVPHNLPNFKVKLEGETGFEHFTKTAENLATIYTSDEFRGVTLTKHIFDQMPQHLKEGKEFILADQYISQEQHTTIHGVWVIQENGVPQGKALFMEHGNFYYEMSVEARMMPIIHLSPNTLVEVENDEYDGSKMGKAIRIRVANNMEIVRQNVLDMVEQSETLNAKIREELAKLK